MYTGDVVAEDGRRICVEKDIELGGRLIYIYGVKDNCRAVPYEPFIKFKFAANHHDHELFRKGFKTSAIAFVKKSPSPMES